MGPLWDCMHKNKDYYEPQLDSLNKGDKEGGSGEGGEKGELLLLSSRRVCVLPEVSHRVTPCLR